MKHAVQAHLQNYLVCAPFNQNLRTNQGHYF